MAGFTVDQIAGAMYGYVSSMLLNDPDGDPFDALKAINARDGFIIEESLDNKLRGDVMRYEGVRVSEEKLTAAYNRAMEWFHST